MDNEAFNPNVITAVCSVVIVGSQWVSRHMGNAKLEATAKDVKDNTSSPEQVARLEAEVKVLQDQVAVLNVRIAKALPPEDRGPGK